MIDWTYGVLPCVISGYKNDYTFRNNPIYLDDIKLTGANKKPDKLVGARFEIKGQGKVIQISFNSDSRDALIAVEIDNQPSSKINNGYCLEGLCDTRGIGNIQIQKVKNKYRCTCLLPFIFDKKIAIYILNEQNRDKVINITDLHIYYLIPKEVK